MNSLTKRRRLCAVLLLVLVAASHASAQQGLNETFGPGREGEGGIAPGDELQRQVVDFNDRTHNEGVYRLLDFADGRHVKTVRLLARSNRDETRLSVYLSK